MMGATNHRSGDSQVDRAGMDAKLDMTAPRILSSTPVMVRKAFKARACGRYQSPESTPWMLPTASERVCGARATLWTQVDQGGRPSVVALLGSDAQAHLGRLGVETTRPRAYTS